MAELSGGAGTTAAAALAFLATSVKDHGAVPACIQLFTRAVAAEPRNASECLGPGGASPPLRGVPLPFCTPATPAAAEGGERQILL